MLFFFTIQKEKYGWIKDIPYILQNEWMAPYLIYFYDYMETMKWSIYDFDNLEKIKNMVEDLLKNKKLEINPNHHPRLLSAFSKESIAYFEENANQKIKKLSKVVSVTLVRSKKYNKNIYIFGEVHYDNFPCKHISEAGNSSANKYVNDLVTQLSHTSSFFNDVLFEGWGMV